MDLGYDRLSKFDVDHSKTYIGSISHVGVAVWRTALKMIVESFLRGACRIPRPNGLTPLYRTFATAAAGSEKLPLAGIRVLDMTRVLAGVRINYLCIGSTLE